MTPPVKKPTELSQRTFKLLHFKDRIEKKRTLLESLLVLLESPDLIAEATVTKISQIRRQWNDVCQPVIETYQIMKIASTGKCVPQSTLRFLHETDLQFALLFATTICSGAGTGEARGATGPPNIL